MLYKGWMLLFWVLWAFALCKTCLPTLETMILFLPSPRFSCENDFQVSGAGGQSRQGRLHRRIYNWFCKIWPLMKSLCYVTWNAIRLTPFSTLNLIMWHPSPASRGCWEALAFYTAIGRPSEGWSKPALAGLCWEAWVGGEVGGQPVEKDEQKVPECFLLGRLWIG